MHTCYRFSARCYAPVVAHSSSRLHHHGFLNLFRPIAPRPLYNALLPRASARQSPHLAALPFASPPTHDTSSPRVTRPACVRASSSNALFHPAAVQIASSIVVLPAQRLPLRVWRARTLLDNTGPHCTYMRLGVEPAGCFDPLVPPPRRPSCATSNRILCFCNGIASIC